MTKSEKQTITAGDVGTLGVDDLETLKTLEATAVPIPPCARCGDPVVKVAEGQPVFTVGNLPKFCGHCARVYGCV